MRNKIIIAFEIYQRDNFYHFAIKAIAEGYLKALNPPDGKHQIPSICMVPVLTQIDSLPGSQI